MDIQYRWRALKINMETIVYLIKFYIISVKFWWFFKNGNYIAEIYLSKINKLL